MVMVDGQVYGPPALTCEVPASPVSFIGEGGVALGPTLFPDRLDFGGPTCRYTYHKSVNTSRILNTARASNTSSGSDLNVLIEAVFQKLAQLLSLLSKHLSIVY